MNWLANCPSIFFILTITLARVVKAKPFFFPILNNKDGPRTSRLSMPEERAAPLPVILLRRLSPLKLLPISFRLRDAWLLPTIMPKEKRFRSHLYLLSATFAGLDKTPLTPQ